MIGQFPNLRYFLERGNKVVIADDGQSVEHVDGLEGGDKSLQKVNTPLVLVSFYTGITSEHSHRVRAESQLHSSSAPW